MGRPRRMPAKQSIISAVSLCVVTVLPGCSAVSSSADPPVPTTAHSAIPSAVPSAGAALAFTVAGVRPVLPSGSQDTHAQTPAASCDSATFALALIGELDSLVRIDAPANTNELAGIDPGLIARAAAARRPLAELQLSKRWCGTLVPTPALAQQAGMGEDGLRRFVTRALFLDRPDPVAAWRRAPATGRRADRAARSSAGDPDRGRRHRPAARGARPNLDQLRRQAQHAQRRGVHGPARALGERHDPVHGSDGPRGVAVTGVELRSRRRGRATPAPSAGRTTSTPRWRPTRARASSVNSGSAPIPASTGRPARSCSTRRWRARSTSRSAAPTPRPAA